MSRHRLALTNPDNPSGTTAPTEHHVAKRLLAAVLTAACMLDASATNVAPTVAMTAPSANAAFVAPAAITLSANATDSDGTIQKVEFYSGATLLATDTEAPFSFVWTNVAAGTYQLTAKATDDANEATTSAVQSVTVAAPAGSAAPNVFFIFSDQINTAREITNGAQVKVWQAEPEPFGANLPDENPAGQGVFPYNQRFPGQYFDKETGLHYNYYRDYDPQSGRYVQSDPIGLEGGINTYGYVGGNPLTRVDPFGLQAVIMTPVGPFPIIFPLFPLRPPPSADPLHAEGMLPPLPTPLNPWKDTNTETRSPPFCPPDGPDCGAALKNNIARCEKWFSSKFSMPQRLFCYAMAQHAFKRCKAKGDSGDGDPNGDGTTMNNPSF